MGSLAPSFSDATLTSVLGITHSVSQAWRLGRAVALCRKKNDLKSIPTRILEIQNGACVFIGKIVDVSRVSGSQLGLNASSPTSRDEQEVRKGFTWGSVTIAPLMEDEEEDGEAAASSAPVAYGPDDRLVIPFQNENLYACLERPDGSSKVCLPNCRLNPYSILILPVDPRDSSRSHHCSGFTERSSPWDA